ncbi:hypothetical protein LIER_40431 [Lithospermum erythrorhizon]|uniref:Aquaporin n=1 Tax=Lithospermum erythrorhizon TaxID=34254 RepID=A0AAV3R039_LITER
MESGDYLHEGLINENARSRSRMTLVRKVVAEVIATYLLVFATCGAAALNGVDESKVPKLGASIVGGLIVLVMIYAVGHISGAHMNPAVSIAFASVRFLPWIHVSLN